MTDVALEDLPFDELRQRAFKHAEHHADLGFFTDLFSHMPSMYAIEGETSRPACRYSSPNWSRTARM